MQHKSKYWNGISYVCECGKSFDKSQSINAHFSHCEIHSNIVGRIHSRDYFHPNKGNMVGWKNKSKEEINYLRTLCVKSRKQNMKLGLTKPSFLGRKHTEETKEKIRTAALDRIDNKYGGIRCNFSKKACEYIDKLNVQYNWQLQHGLNGGEKRISNYWVDGYDEQNKIVFEYDEPKHYISDTNQLKEKDMIRQNKILCILGKGWKFYRYNEKLDLLYKIS